MKRSWMIGIICMMLGVLIVMGDPTRAEAASQSDRDAYWAVFDASYYYNAYPDVAAACGTDADALFNHFVSYGVYEGRSASAAFNPQAYRQRYTDLQEAFGNDMAAYCRHYVTFGAAEGRNAAADGQPVVAMNVTIEKKDVSKVQSKEEQPSDTKTEEKPADTKQQEETREPEADAKAAQAVKGAADTKAEQSAKDVTDTKAEQTEARAAETAQVQSTDNALVQTAATTSGQTVIGTCTTSYQDDIPRAVNVELAAQRINGVVVQPDGSFSFSNTILERTSANGYVEAPIFISGKTGTGIGGGVCQVSSTLYAAMVYAGLPATERHAHSLPVDYLPEGLDATIAGNYMDLRFTNTFSQPLLIEASAEGGTLTVTLVLQ